MMVCFIAKGTSGFAKGTSGFAKGTSGFAKGTSGFAKGTFGFEIRESIIESILESILESISLNNHTLELFLFGTTSINNTIKVCFYSQRHLRFRNSGVNPRIHNGIHFPKQPYYRMIPVWDQQP
jgi:hypothetical protein